MAPPSPPDGPRGGACQQCGKPLENPQRCRACGTFQHADPRRDHFATLAIPRGFDVDESLLERHLVSFGRDLHPDLSATEGCQRTLAVLGAAQLNEAYAIVRDPYRRGEYLLKLEGGRSASEDKSVPEGFLDAMLDERDALDTALAAGGETLARTRSGFEQKLRELTAELSRGFARLAADGERDATLAALRRTLNVMAYYRGLLRHLRDAAHDAPLPGPVATKERP